MARKVLILGNSGASKTYSLRNLNEEETFIIQCTKKDLPFRNYTKRYNQEKKTFFVAKI